MDVLDKYKKAWDNQPEDSQKVSRDKIFKMTHARSSSIVKWILIIGLCEFGLLLLSYFFFDYDKGMKVYESMGLKNFVIYSQLLFYPIICYFLFQFYMNYKNISVIDDTKNLMRKILKTRKTVKFYVLFNLSYIVILWFVVLSSLVFNETSEISSKITIGFIIAMIILSIVVIAAFWLIYQLLYGILLRKLNKNYKELAKLDELN